MLCNVLTYIVVNSNSGTQIHPTAQGSAIQGEPTQPEHRCRSLQKHVVYASLYVSLGYQLEHGQLLPWGVSSVYPSTLVGANTDACSLALREAANSAELKLQELKFKKYETTPKHQLNQLLHRQNDGGLIPTPIPPLKESDAEDEPNPKSTDNLHNHSIVDDDLAIAVEDMLSGDDEAKVEDQLSSISDPDDHDRGPTTIPEGFHATPTPALPPEKEETCCACYTYGNSYELLLGGSELLGQGPIGLLPFLNPVTRLQPTTNQEGATMTTPTGFLSKVLREQVLPAAYG
ncbi:Nucleoprotein [Fukomys damarensis]|uniref:Nucleoprotein n=1 Tax=Fukomys damarensis TaxID=885580 RepID=A0A091CLL8_FUKDA|nr:Nucleoprotein [Fukomys damarensis]